MKLLSLMPVLKNFLPALATRTLMLNCLTNYYSDFLA